MAKQPKRAGGLTARSPSGLSGPQKPTLADPLPTGALKTMVVRLVVLLLAVWFVGATIAVFVQSSTTRAVVLGIPGVITVGVVSVALWAYLRARKAKGVAGILAGVESDQDRKRAIAELEQGFKANDPAAVFAKAQLQLQEDPRAALATLEQINLGKVMAAVADEARAQRGMIHLMLGEVNAARDLADGIDLTRHQDARSRAMMGAVVAEAWARSGQAQRALKTIDLFNPEDDDFAQLRPQLYRARAYVYAYVNDPKALKRALRKLAETDPRLLGGFLTKRTHPLLQREAKILLEQYGAVQRKMQFQR